jgi:Calcineurin-like phosphoesterase
MNKVRVALALLLLGVPFAAFGASQYIWLQYGPDGPIARAIVPGNGPCPNIVINRGTPRQMTLRAGPSSTGDYNVTSCETALDESTTSATINGVALPVAKLNQSLKIAIIGDTGCRMKVSSSGKAQIQDCSDPNAWPFATNIQSIAKWNPDLVIQVGDYYYREAKQDSQGNWVKAGYNWKNWEADFFKPASPLLLNAPWIFVRGNHEMCTRAAGGWFRFLDPHIYSWEGQSQCTSNLDYTRQYVVTVGNQSFAVMDSSAADDTSNVDQDQVSIYSAQLRSLDAGAPAGTWLLLHHPFWVLQDGGTGTPTMYTAWGDWTPTNISLVVAGHKHLLETLDFTDDGVPQVVIGNGGTSLTGAPTLGTGTSINRRVVQNLYVRDNFGFLAATPATNANGWTMKVMSEKGNEKANCTFTTGSFVCTGD